MIYSYSPYMDFELETSSPSVAKAIDGGNVNELLKGLRDALLDAGWYAAGNRQAQGYAWIGGAPVTDPSEPPHILDKPIRPAIFAGRADPTRSYFGLQDPEPDGGRILYVLCWYDPTHETPIDGLAVSGASVVWVEMGASEILSLDNLISKLAELFPMFDFSITSGFTAPDYNPADTQPTSARFVLWFTEKAPGSPDGNDWRFYRSAGGSTTTTQGGFVLRSGTYLGGFLELIAFRNRLGHAMLAFYPNGLSAGSALDGSGVNGSGLAFHAQLQPILTPDGTDYAKYYVYACPDQLIVRDGFYRSVDPSGMYFSDVQARWPGSTGLLASNLWQPEDFGQPLMLFVGPGFKTKLHWTNCRLHRTGGSLYRSYATKLSTAGVLTLRHEQYPVRTWSGKPIIGNATVMGAYGEPVESMILGKLWNAVTMSDLVNPLQAVDAAGTLWTDDEGYHFNNFSEADKYWEVSRQLGTAAARVPQAGLWYRSDA